MKWHENEKPKAEGLYLIRTMDECYREKVMLAYWVNNRFESYSKGHAPVEEKVVGWIRNPLEKEPETDRKPTENNDAYRYLVEVPTPDRKSKYMVCRYSEFGYPDVPPRSFYTKKGPVLNVIKWFRIEPGTDSQTTGEREHKREIEEQRKIKRLYWEMCEAANHFKD